jgi:hypothetical protein
MIDKLIVVNFLKANLSPLKTPFFVEKIIT